MRYLILILLLTFTACSEDKPTESSAPVLDRTTHSWTGISWNGVDYVEADTKFRMLYVNNEGLKVSWILEFRNTHPTRTTEVNINRLVFEDKDGFQLAEHVLSFPALGSVVKVTLPPNSNSTYKNESTVRIYDVDIANSIERMNVWASFTQL